MRWPSPGRRLAGEKMSFTDEVAGYFQVRIEEVDTDVYAQAHDEISGLLGGSGPLADRFADDAARPSCALPTSSSARSGSSPRSSAR